MRTIVITLPLALLAATTSALGESTTVFENISPDGVPTFSDQATPGAVPEQIEKPNLMQPIDADMSPTVSPATHIGETKITINITSPTPQQSIWSGNGDIKLYFNSDSTPPDTTYQVLLDSQLQGSTSNDSLVLHNVSRGEHKLQIKAMDYSGKLLGQSPIVVFYVHRPIS